MIQQPEMKLNITMHDFCYSVTLMAVQSTSTMHDFCYSVNLMAVQSISAISFHGLYPHTMFKTQLVFASTNYPARLHCFFCPFFNSFCGCYIAHVHFCVKVSKPVLIKRPRAALSFKKPFSFSGEIKIIFLILKQTLSCLHFILVLVSPN